jgi:putative hydrolase of the HAD superfamily
MHAPQVADIDVLLFDFGGVIVDIDFGRAFAGWALAAGVPPASVAAHFRFDDAYAAHERGEIRAAEYFASLRRSLGIDLSDEQFLAGWNAIFVGEAPGMRTLLAAAAKARALYLFSNTCEAHRRYWMPRYRDLLQPFADVFLSCDLGMRKPEREAFEFVAGRIGVPPSRIAFFDDRAENVAGARSAGLRAFQVRSSTEVAAALAPRP